MMAISPFFAPINSASRTAARFGAGRQMFVRAYDVPRCPLEMEPGEVARKSAHQWLKKSQTHHEQTRGDSVESRLDPRPDHVGKRHGKRAAKHQIGNDPQ